LWLAPEQVRVLPISDEVASAAQAVTDKLKRAGLRAALDNRADTLNYRIRDGEVTRVPYMAVIGKREAEAGTVALRVRGAGNKQEIVPVDEFVARLVRETTERTLAP
jgi:threonyl-tRNA synthetase